MSGPVADVSLLADAGVIRAARTVEKVATV